MWSPQWRSSQDKGKVRPKAENAFSGRKARFLILTSGLWVQQASIPSMYTTIPRGHPKILNFSFGTWQVVKLQVNVILLNGSGSSGNTLRNSSQRRKEYVLHHHHHAQGLNQEWFVPVSYRQILQLVTPALPRTSHTSPSPRLAVP